MSMVMPDPWMPEEPPDFVFVETVLEEPPPATLDGDFADWVYDTSIPEEPPDLFPPESHFPEPPLPEEDVVLARLDQYVPRSIPSADDYPVSESIYADPVLELAEETIPVRTEMPASEPVQRDPNWQLEQSGILIEQTADKYAVGVVELWNDPQTGEQTGAYLHMADAPHLARAEEMRDNIYRLADEAGVSDHTFGDFAQGLIKGRRDWQPLTDEQWQQIEVAPSPDLPDFQDDATWAARDRLLTQAFAFADADDKLQRADIDEPHELQAVIGKLGIQIEDFDPAVTPPPLFDEKTNTAYWIGVYQPDPNNPQEAITSILSIGLDAAGKPEAHLAPVAMGDWDHASQTATYLLEVAQKTQDVDRLFDAAEAMAVATQHRELWDTAQGIPVEQDITFSPMGMEIE